MTDEAEVDLGREIGLALRALLQAGREMNVVLARRLDVGVTDLQAMDHLVSSPSELGPAQLAHLLGIRSASASVLVDRLESAGHVRRQRSDPDRRRVRLSVTDAAQAEVRTAMQPLLARLAEVTQARTPAEQRQILEFLGAVTDVIREFAESPPQATGQQPRG